MKKTHYIIWSSYQKVGGYQHINSIERNAFTNSSDQWDLRTDRARWAGGG